MTTQQYLEQGILTSVVESEAYTLNGTSLDVRFKTLIVITKESISGHLEFSATSRKEADAKAIQCIESLQKLK